MLYRDVSEIQNDENTCNTIVSTSVIYGFKDNNQTRNRYVLIEDKYVKSSSDTGNYNISNYHCITNQELAALSSNANRFQPFYVALGFSLSVLTLVLVWSLLKSILGRRA